MKKIFTLVATALVAISANAQQIYTEVEPNTYAITMTAEEASKTFEAPIFNISDPIEKSWIMLPANHIACENEKLTIKAGADDTPIWFQGNKLGDVQKTFPTYTAYLNLGTTLGQNNWKETDANTVEDASTLKASWQGFLAVVPKVDGTLGFGVYAGDNSRSIGIIDLSSEEEILNEKPSSFVAYANFRNGDPSKGEDQVCSFHGTKHEPNAPEYVEGAVKAGRTYLLVGGGSKNLCMHQVTFVPGQGTGIENVEAVEGAKVAPKKVFKNGQIMIGDFNIAGQRVK